ncbi:MAG: hypothetical protein SGPRY_014493, partial [Prymnesium sp.]
MDITSMADMNDDFFAQLPDMLPESDLERMQEVSEQPPPHQPHQPSPQPLVPPMEDVVPGWSTVREPDEHLPSLPQAAAPTQMDEETLDVEAMRAELFGEKTNQNLDIAFIEQVLTHQEDLIANGMKILPKPSFPESPSVIAQFVQIDEASTNRKKKRKLEDASSSTQGEEVYEATTHNGIASGSVHPTGRDETLGIVKLSAKNPPFGCTVNYWSFVDLKQPLEKMVTVRDLKYKPKYKTPKVLLVRCHPSTARKVKSLIVEELEANNVNINGKLTFQGKDMYEEIQNIVLKVLEEYEDAKGPSRSYGAVTSANEDFAEWIVKEDPTEELLPGHLVQGRANKISKRISDSEDGGKGVLFVVSTAPAFVGGTPSKDSAIVAMLGRVPVRICGDAHVGWYLVPSGKLDGLARCVSPDKLQQESHLQELCFGIAWELLPLDKLGVPSVLAL